MNIKLKDQKEHDLYYFEFLDRLSQFVDIKFNTKGQFTKELNPLRDFLKEKYECEDRPSSNLCSLAKFTPKNRDGGDM